MGIIVDQNSDANSIDDWAIVSGTTVSNIISADLSFIQSIQAYFTYAVDISVGGQSTGIGYIYDSGADTFSPPPVNYVALLQADVNALQGAYLQILSDYNAAIADSHQSDADSGIAAGITDASASYSTNESTPFTSLVGIVSTGG